MAEAKRRRGRKPMQNAALDRLQDVTGMTDEKIAELIGVSVRTMNGARRKGGAPYSAIVAAVRAGALAVDLHWLFVGAVPAGRATP